MLILSITWVSWCVTQLIFMCLKSVPQCHFCVYVTQENAALAEKLESLEEEIQHVQVQKRSVDQMHFVFLSQAHQLLQK